MTYHVEFVLGNLSRGAFEISDLTVFFGHIGSGKTLFLRIFHDAVSFSKSEGFPVESELKDLAEMFGNIEIKVRSEKADLHLRCVSGRDIEEPSCDYENGKQEFDRETYMIPYYFDTLLRFNMLYPFQPSDAKFIFSVISFLASPTLRRRIPSYINEILGKLEDKLFSRRFVVKGKRFIEKVNDEKEIPTIYSASSYLRSGLLINILSYLANEQPLVLIDEPDIGLHPVAMKQLALFLHVIARNGTPVILVTHNLLFLDMLRRIDKIARELSVDIEPADMTLIITEKSETKTSEARYKIKNIDPMSSAIESYTDEIIDLYN
ncbi:MAG: AAA family ATPase [Sulfolobales archaeon]